MTTDAASGPDAGAGGPDAGAGLGTIFKAYDVRGTVPDELSPRIAYGSGRVSLGLPRKSRAPSGS